MHALTPLSHSHVLIKSQWPKQIEGSTFLPFINSGSRSSSYGFSQSSGLLFLRDWDSSCCLLNLEPLTDLSSKSFYIYRIDGIFTSVWSSQKFLSFSPSTILSHVSLLQYGASAMLQVQTRVSSTWGTRSDRRHLYHFCPGSVPHFILTHSLSVLLPAHLSLELASCCPLRPEFFRKFY